VTTVNEALAALREHWGGLWEVWVVPLALGGGSGGARGGTAIPCPTCSTRTSPSTWPNT